MARLRNLRELFKNSLASRKRKSVPVSDADGPFRYTYIAISHVVGAQFPKDASDPLEVAHFPEVDARAFLTNQWDTYYEQIDTGNAIATVMLGALFLGTRFRKARRYWSMFLQWVFGAEWVFLKNLRKKKDEVRSSRLKSHSGSGCGLVYVAEQPVNEHLRLDASRRYGKLGVALDAIDRGSIRSKHEAFVRSISTAVSIAMSGSDGSPEIRFLADGSYLSGAEDLILHLRTLEAGAVGIVVSTPTSEQLTRTVQDDAVHLATDRKLSVASSLFALSQYKSNDNLRSFMAAWSALEFLINILEKRVRATFWAHVESGAVSLPDWDMDLSNISINDYRLKDRFYVVAAYFSTPEAEEDIQKFIHVNVTRGDYYHRLGVAESDLPTRDAQNLFRKYLGLALKQD